MRPTTATFKHKGRQYGVRFTFAAEYLYEMWSGETLSLLRARMAESMQKAVEATAALGEDASEAQRTVVTAAALARANSPLLSPMTSATLMRAGLEGWRRQSRSERDELGQQDVLAMLDDLGTAKVVTLLSRALNLSVETAAEDESESDERAEEGKDEPR